MGTDRFAIFDDRGPSGRGQRRAGAKGDEQDAAAQVGADSDRQQRHFSIQSRDGLPAVDRMGRTVSWAVRAFADS